MRLVGFFVFESLRRLAILGRVRATPGRCLPRTLFGLGQGCRPAFAGKMKQDAVRLPPHYMKNLRSQIA
jgi:hypothetical protein